MNRLRIGEPNDNDRALLESRRLKPEDDSRIKKAMHTYYTNVAASKWNKERLDALQEKEIEIKAKVSKAGQYVFKTSDYGTIDNTQFMNVLKIKKGARIMIIYNVRTSDGIVNGATGTVLGFEYFSETSDSDVKAIIVKFDDPETGKQHAKDYPGLCWKYADQQGVAILRSTMQYNPSRGHKGKFHGTEVQIEQFPIRLAWASTGHKLQGITIKAGCDLVCHGNKGGVPNGLYYVMLSRVKCLENLFIDQDFNINKIVCNTSAFKQNEKLNKRCIVSKYKEHKFDIFYANVRSLNGHLEELKNDLYATRARFICLVETWLPFERDCESNLDGYRFIHASIGPGKGVAIFARENEEWSLVSQFVCNDFQILTIKMNNDIQLFVVYLYHSISSQMKRFFLKKMDDLQDKNLKPFIVGDFNFDYGEKSNISDFFEKKTMIQLVKEPTNVQAGNTIDHIYADPKIAEKVELTSRAWFFNDHLAFTLNLFTD